MKKTVLTIKFFITKWQLDEIFARRANMTLDEVVWSKLYKMPDDIARQFLIDYKSTGHDFGAGSVADKAYELGLCDERKKECF